VRRVVGARDRRGPARARRDVGAARVRPHWHGATRSGGNGVACGGAAGAGVAAGGVVSVRAKRCLTLFMKDLYLHVCTAGRLSLHLQEVLERFEVRL
jgi:hypothetical protein